MGYTFDDIKRAYAEAGVSRGRVVLVKTDLRRLGAFDGGGRTALLQAHLRALADLVDPGLGTIVVSTASTSLCNTSTPFDPANTPGERGVLPEFVRTQPGAVRSHHAFMSHTALGAQAETICANVSRHSYGLHTPKDRMLELDALYLSVGLEPRWTCSYVHHVEMLMGVPYRYTKEFEHPVVQPDGSILPELFYLYVWYRSMDLKRNVNVNIFEHYLDSGQPMNQASLGEGGVWGYPCVNFCRATAEFLRRDIYGWLDAPPENRPYRT